MYICIEYTHYMYVVNESSNSATNLFFKTGPFCVRPSVKVVVVVRVVGPALKVPLVVDRGFVGDEILPSHGGGFYMCQGLNSHHFHIIGDGHQPNSRGLYTHYKDSLLKVG